MARPSLKDPADAGKEKKIKAEIEDKERSLDISSLKFEDFKTVPSTAARTPHPFEGYPEKKIIVGEYKDIEPKLPNGKKNPHFGKIRDLILNLTHLVGLNPTVDVFQDSSGQGITIGDPKKGNERVVNIASSHNRVVSYQGKAWNAVFDREAIFKDGRKLLYSIIPDPIYRSQIIYFYNAKTERIEVNKNYLLPDPDQKSKLRQVFQLLINPRLRVERLASAISGESEESLDDLKSIPDEIQDQE